jgi:hypothetical protein
MELEQNVIGAIYGRCECSLQMLTSKQIGAQQCCAGTRTRRNAKHGYIPVNLCSACKGLKKMSFGESA